MSTAWPDPAEARKALEAVLASDVFRSRESLRRLLSFLVERTLEGTADELKEYTVGVAVFGKPSTYDPQTDSSARVLLGKLRKSLEEYYRTEGSRDELAIEVPQRRFAVQFRPRPTPNELPAAPPGGRRTWLWAAMVGVAIAAAAAGFFAGRSQPGSLLGREDEASLMRFWGPLRTSRQPTVVCLATPFFLGLGTARFRDSSFESVAEAEQQEFIRDLQRALRVPAALSHYEYTGVGEAISAFLIGRLFAAMRQPAEIRRESAVTWEDIKNYNVVFLGSAKFNPKLRQLSRPVNFLVERGGIRNASPRPGESLVYKAKAGEGPAWQMLEDYALISRLPGMQPNNVFVVLGASSSTGAWAAAECVTKPHYLNPLLNRIAAGGEVPPYFEMVVKVQNRAGVPVSTAYVTHRVLPSGEAGLHPVTR